MKPCSVYLPAKYEATRKCTDYGSYGGDKKNRGHLRQRGAGQQGQVRERGAKNTLIEAL